jgi:hypothetical protein
VKTRVGDRSSKKNDPETIKISIIENEAKMEKKELKTWQ